MRLIDLDHINIVYWCVRIPIAAKAFPPLQQFLDEKDQIDLGDPEALSVYNQAVVRVIAGLDISVSPPYLIPTICLRHAYLIVLMDGILERGDKIVEVGTGASAVIAMLGAKLYDLQVIATEIDEKSLETAQKNVDHNNLSEKISLTASGGGILSEVISSEETIKAVLCNPPMYPEQDRITYELHEPTTGFRGTASEMIGGGEQGFDFVEQLVKETHQLKIENICLLLISEKLVSMTQSLLHELGWTVRKVELQAGTRTRYVIVGNL